MVKKYDIHGNVYHEPPYTKEEEMEMYQRMSGLVAFTRASQPTLSSKDGVKNSAPRKPRS